MQPLRTADGFPTKAVYVFANMLRKVIREESPDGVAVVMDPPGGSFRREVYAEYKANREAQPEELSQQIPVMHELVAAWNLPVLEVAGFEADDVIASLVEAAAEDTEIVIVSTDKDLMQLVTERVVLLDTMKDRRIGPNEVVDRFGVPPEKLLDVRALVGDPSDNIPGVKGIGEKGAAKLIGEWGDLETLLDNAEKVKAKKAREGLEQHADDARLSKELATLRSDVELPVAPEALATPEPDVDTLRALYRRLEFVRLLEELEGGSEDAPDVVIEAVAVDSESALADVVDELASAERLAIALVGDPEAGGLPPEPAGIALSGDGARGYYLAFGHGTLLEPAGLEYGSTLERLRPLFEGPSARPWIARNTKRVQTLLAELGFEVTRPCFDIELAAFLIDPAAQRGTSVLAGQWLSRTHRSWEEVAGRGAKAIPPGELALDVATTWAAEEVCALYALPEPLTRRLTADGLAPLFEDVELPLTAVLSRVERNGVRIDEAKLRDLSDEYDGELARIEAHITELAGESFTVNSPKQLQHILFDKLGLKPVKKTKTGYSTDESVLEQLAAEHELPGEVLAWRRLAKLKSTYVDALPPLVDARTGRIHPTFNQIGAATGRLSSTHPNVQNIPIRTVRGHPHPRGLRPGRGTGSCSRRTTRRSSCGSSRTTPATRA